MEQIQGIEKPEPPAWILDNIAEASKNTAKIYFIYIGFLTYCALTIVSTTDRQLVVNSTTNLPIINVHIPLVYFFLVGPWMAIFIFLYMQIYLSRLKGLRLELEEYYAPVGRRRLYPWIMTIAESPEPGILGTLQKRMVKLSFWWTLPIVLILFSLWIGKKHELFLSRSVGITTIIGTIITICSAVYYERRSGRVKDDSGYISALSLKKISNVLLIVAIIGFEIFILNTLDMVAKGRTGWSWLNVDLSREKLVAEPLTDYKGLYWANLNKSHLDGAILDYAVLKRADLRGARLQNAMISYAVLVDADLEDANLTDSYLSVSNLNGANLLNAVLCRADIEYATLKKANLDHANLQGAHFEYSNCTNAEFYQADLSGAYFEEANLEGANFHEANLSNANDLTVAQLSTVKTLYKANIAPELKEQLLLMNYSSLFVEHISMPETMDPVGITKE